MTKNKAEKKLNQISSIIEGFWFSGIEPKQCSILVFDVDFQSTFDLTPKIDTITQFKFDLGIFCAWSIPHLLHINNILSYAGYKVRHLKD